MVYPVEAVVVFKYISAFLRVVDISEVNAVVDVDISEGREHHPSVGQLLNESYLIVAQSVRSIYRYESLKILVYGADFPSMKQKKNCHHQKSIYSRHFSVVFLYCMQI